MLEAERRALEEGKSEEELRLLRLQAWDFMETFTGTDHGKRTLACLYELAGAYHTYSPDEAIPLAKTVAIREFYNEIELLIKYAQAEGAGNE